MSEHFVENIELKCGLCGSSVITMSYNKGRKIIYCSDCRKKKVVEWRKKSMKKFLENNKKKFNEFMNKQYYNDIEIKSKGRGFGAHRKKILALFNNKCADCGSSENLQIHHIKYVYDKPKKHGSNLEFNINNVLVLCRNCHRKMHSEINLAIKTEKFIY